MGLWLVQESRRQWAREGRDLEYQELTRLAEEAPALRSVVPDDLRSSRPGTCPRASGSSAPHGQPLPEGEGAVVRCALESLALTYRATAEQIAAVTGARIERLHIVGGGSRNGLLDRFAAAALRVPVVAGPVEATATGNILMQAVALGRLPDLAALRKVVRASHAPSCSRRGTAGRGTGPTSGSGSYRKGGSRKAEVGSEGRSEVGGDGKSPSVRFRAASRSLRQREIDLLEVGPDDGRGAADHRDRNGEQPQVLELPGRALVPGDVPLLEADVLPGKIALHLAAGAAAR